MLTLLHTSDWHLGRRLYGKVRYDEFAQFLNWQINVIKQHQVDVLLIAGDIFDTASPSNQAQTLYYDFLKKVSQTDCRHIIIVGGNHDSPSFLDAPKGILKFLNIHVVGSISENIADEILVLKDKHDVPEMMVVAVPYLRDRDVRTVASGERLDDKEAKLTTGIKDHYKTVTDLAIAKQSELEKQFNKKIPIIGTGHLFAAGGVTVEGDGVRELYVGSLAHVNADIFDSRLDYVALGHLHVPQTVGGQAHIRYSGSPIAMGFGESEQQKQVHLVRFNVENNLTNQPYFSLLNKNSSTNSTPLSSSVKKTKPKTPTSFDLFADEADDALSETAVEMIADTTDNPINLAEPYNLVMLNDMTLLQSLAVPTFQRLQTVKGDWQYIKSTLQALKKSGEAVWLEVVYDSDTVMGDLREQVNALIQDSKLDVIRIKNQQVRNQTLKAQTANELLEDLDEKQVFERCLVANNVTDEQKPVMWARYAEVLETLRESHS